MVSQPPAHRQGTHERLEWLVELGWMLMSLPEGCAPLGGSSGSSQLTRWVLSEVLVGPSPEVRIPAWRDVMRGVRPELISLHRRRGKLTHAEAGGAAPALQPVRKPIWGSRGPGEPSGV